MMRTTLKQLAMADALPSWNEGVAKASIVDFVSAVTDSDSGF